MGYKKLYLRNKLIQTSCYVCICFIFVVVVVVVVVVCVCVCVCFLTESYLHC